jgi:pimeloyl-ACP methyl ester carboxylesterase
MADLRLTAARPMATLVLLPGFMSSAESYRALVSPVVDDGISVLVAQLYPRGIRALTGRHTVEDEARDAAELVRREVRDGTRVVLAGHSRGGQAAWRAANLLATEGVPAALVLVDPVDGAGREPSTPTATREPARFACPTLVIGAGVGGRCAPEPVNHRMFAAATPHARHVVVRELGHADMLDARARSLGRRLCGGAAHPDDGRALVTALLRAAALDDMDATIAASSGLVVLR